MGLLGGLASTMFSGFMDSALSKDDIYKAPIPAFYFEVVMYDTKGFNAKEIEKIQTLTGMAAMAEAAEESAKALIPSTSIGLELGSPDLKSAFIEVSGIEIGLEGKKTFNEGGYNFPIDLPDKMKNSAITLKRLVRPLTLDLEDDWKKWCGDTFEAMAYWQKKITTKIIQVNIMHPNGADVPIILNSINFFDAYPSKVTLSALNSTSEDLLIEEIEISYSSSLSKYNSAPA
jgi:hypothetical protein